MTAYFRPGPGRKYRYADWQKVPLPTDLRDGSAVRIRTKWAVPDATWVVNMTPAVSIPPNDVERPAVPYNRPRAASHLPWLTWRRFRLVCHAEASVSRTLSTKGPIQRNSRDDDSIITALFSSRSQAMIPIIMAKVSSALSGHPSFFGFTDIS